jgi:hypothetical protein
MPPVVRRRARNRSGSPSGRSRALHGPGRIAFAAALLVCCHSPAPARAVEGAIAADEGWRVQSTGRLTIDGGLLLGAPAALPTGLSTGIAAGVAFGRNLFAWGARVSWSTATESSIAWTVTNDDLAVRLDGAIQRDVGRGRLALRLGVGSTVIHETRLRNQGARAGLTGSDLETSVVSAVPAGELEAVVGLHIAGPWLVMVSGGPSASIVSSAWRTGWTSQLGVGWQP